MKITSLLIGVCMLAIFTGCHKPQAIDVIGAAEATCKTTALAAITSKYPELSSSDLKFGDLNIRALRNGNEAVFVLYDLTASAKTTTNGMKATTSMKSIIVDMSLSGKVDGIRETKRAETYDVAQ